MAALIPSHLVIDAVVFPLEADGPWLNVSQAVAELQPLRAPLDELVNGDARAQPIERVLADGYAVQGIVIEPTDPRAPPRTFSDGLVSWFRLSGAWPDVSNAMLARTGFMRNVLVLPKPALAELVETLRRFRHEIETGAREGKLDDAPVPPPPPLTPELQRLAALAGDREAAQQYREELYDRRR